MITPQKTADILNIFNAQGAMKLIGARLTEVDEGVAEFDVDFRPELSQQHGYFHAGIISTLIDTAGGCAGATMMPPGSNVLTVEFKVNLLAPGDGEGGRVPLNLTAGCCTSSRLMYSTLAGSETSGSAAAIDFSAESLAESEENSSGVRTRPKRIVTPFAVITVREPTQSSWKK